MFFYLAQTRSYNKFQAGNKDRHREALFHLINSLENQSIPEKLPLFENCNAKTQAGWIGYSNPKRARIQQTGLAKHLGKEAIKANEASKFLNTLPRTQNLSSLGSISILKIKLKSFLKHSKFQ